MESDLSILSTLGYRQHSDEWSMHLNILEKIPQIIFSRIPSPLYQFPFNPAITEHFFADTDLFNVYFDIGFQMQTPLAACVMETNDSNTLHS